MKSQFAREMEQIAVLTKHLCECGLEWLKAHPDKNETAVEHVFKTYDALQQQVLTKCVDWAEWKRLYVRSAGECLVVTTESIKCEQDLVMMHKKHLWHYLRAACEKCEEDALLFFLIAFPDKDIMTLERLFCATVHFWSNREDQRVASRKMICLWLYFNKEDPMDVKMLSALTAKRLAKLKQDMISELNKN